MIGAATPDFTSIGGIVEEALTDGKIGCTDRIGLKVDQSRPTKSYFSTFPKNSMYITQPHIQSLIESNNAIPISQEISEKFEKKLLMLPWNLIGSGLDWSQIKSTQTHIAALSSSQADRWIAGTALKHDSHLIFWLGSDEPCIASPLHHAISIIDFVFWKRPGRQLMFGANINNTVNPNYSHIMEYDGGDRLVAAV